MQERVTDQQGAARSTAAAADTMFLMTSAVPVGENPPSASCSVDFKQQEKSETNRERPDLPQGAVCLQPFPPGGPDSTSRFPSSRTGSKHIF